MRGAFYCPHCHTPNACTCENCKDAIKPEDTIPEKVGGDGLRCGKCKKEFSYDEALDTEWELKIKPLSVKPSEFR